MTEEAGYVHFADGFQALYYRRGPDEVYEGLGYTTLFVVPSKVCRQYYKITEKDLLWDMPDGMKAMKKKYLKHNVTFILDAPKAEVWVLCNFDGSESRFQREQSNYTYIKAWERESQEKGFLLASNAKLRTWVKNLLSQQGDFYKGISYNLEVSKDSSKPKPDDLKETSGEI